MRRIEKFWRLQRELEDKRDDIRKVHAEYAAIQAEMSQFLKSIPDDWILADVTDDADAPVPE